MSTDAHPISSVEIIKVVKVIVIRGTGVDTNPLRHVTQWWDLENKLIAEDDPVAPGKISFRPRRGFEEFNGP